MYVYTHIWHCTPLTISIYVVLHTSHNFYIYGIAHPHNFFFDEMIDAKKRDWVFFLFSNVTVPMICSGNLV